LVNPSATNSMISISRDDREMSRGSDESVDDMVHVPSAVMVDPINRVDPA
jgi:hypothetical protein